MLLRYAISLIFFLSIDSYAYLKTPFLDYFEKINHQKLPGECKHPDFSYKDHLSCARVVAGVAFLNDKYAILGHADEKTKKVFYLKSIEDNKRASFAPSSKNPLANALCLINSDKQTSVCLDPFLFDETSLFHCHISQLSNFDLLSKALALAKKNGIKVSLDLGSTALVQLHKEKILNLLPKYIDIVFANEQEIKELTQLPPLQACEFLSSLCEVVVVTMGYSGCWIKSKGLKFYTPSLKTNQIPNAGVGDLFISGFLYGYLNKASLPECSWTGSFVASKALEQGIKKFDYLFWKDVSKQLQQEVMLIPKDSRKVSSSGPR
jgi:hypothetical protein